MASSPIQSPIKHVFVLMLENRSYDHLLGFLPREGHLGAVDGLSGDEFNLINPRSPSSQRYYVQEGAQDELYTLPAPGPAHDFFAANVQLTGYAANPGPCNPPRSNGFVQSYVEELTACSEDPTRFWARPDQIKLVMQCFHWEQIPALATLAREFVLCDRWFSSVPGPTMPNRFYVHAATSAGYAINDGSKTFDMETIQNRLEDAGRTWRVYYSNVNELFLLSRVPQTRDRMRHFDEHFESDVGLGDVADYTYLIPRFIAEDRGAAGVAAADDEHAPSSVGRGDRLIARIYAALRANPEVWKSCLFVILFDEHGGFYDHSIPPCGVPNPDGLYSPTAGQPAGAPRFDFRRLGFRVPAVLVSPWLRPQVNSTLFEHASIPATLGRFFGLGAPLTLRDSAANSFEHLLTGAGGFREDTPTSLPLAQVPDPGPSRLLDRDSRQLLATVLHREPDRDRRCALLTQLYRGLTDYAASQLVRETVDRFLDRCEARGGQHVGAKES